MQQLAGLELVVCFLFDSFRQSCKQAITRLHQAKKSRCMIASPSRLGIALSCAPYDLAWWTRLRSPRLEGMRVVVSRPIIALPTPQAAFPHAAAAGPFPLPRLPYLLFDFYLPFPFKHRTTSCLSRGYDPIYRMPLLRAVLRLFESTYHSPCRNKLGWRILDRGDVAIRSLSTWTLDGRVYTEQRICPCDRDPSSISRLVERKLTFHSFASDFRSRPKWHHYFRSSTRYSLPFPFLLLPPSH